MTSGRLLLGATPLGQPSDASPRLIDALARAVVQRLLHEPTVRMKQLSDERVHARMQLVRELFGLDAGGAEIAADGEGGLAEVRELPRRRSST